MSTVKGHLYCQTQMYNSKSVEHPWTTGSELQEHLYYDKLSYYILMPSFSFSLLFLMSSETYFKFIVSSYNIKLIWLLHMFSLYIYIIYITFIIHYMYFSYSAVYLHLRFSHLGRQCFAKNLREDFIETFTITLNLPPTSAEEKFLYW